MNWTRLELYYSGDIFCTNFTLHLVVVYLFTACTPFSCPCFCTGSFYSLLLFFYEMVKLCICLCSGSKQLVSYVCTCDRER